MICKTLGFYSVKINKPQSAIISVNVSSIYVYLLCCFVDVMDKIRLSLSESQALNVM